MSIPPFDDDGLLPPGLHECTLDELGDRFGRFQRSDRRLTLLARLREYLAELRNTGLAAFVVVDGSFVTSKAEPEDVDLLVALRHDLDLAADFRPAEYNAISKRQVVKRYPFDMLVAPESTEAYERHRAFFEQVKDRNRKKGLLEVVP